MRDTLPRRPWKNESAIMNLNQLWQKGSHWAAYKKYNNNVQYYDSFGNLPPPKELRQYLGNATIRYNHDRHQEYGSTNCGHLCLEFLRGI